MPVLINQSVNKYLLSFHYHQSIVWVLQVKTSGLLPVSKAITIKLGKQNISAFKKTLGLNYVVFITYIFSEIPGIPVQSLLFLDCKLHEER